MGHVYIIYKIINKINDKFYIGWHKTIDINDEYYGSGLCIKAAIEKYGKQNFKKEILYVFSSRKDAVDKEKELVTEDLVNDPMCYNLTIGGQGGFHYIRKQDKHKSNKGRKIIHNKAINKTTKVLNKDLQKYLDAGWELGFHPDSLKKMSEAGKIKIQNETHRKKNSETKKDSYILENKETGEKKFIKKSISHEYIKNGWTIFVRKNIKDKILIHNVSTKKSIYVNKEEINEYIKNGWSKGRLLNNNL